MILSEVVKAVFYSAFSRAAKENSIRIEEFEPDLVSWQFRLMVSVQKHILSRFYL